MVYHCEASLRDRTPLQTLKPPPLRESSESTAGFGNLCEETGGNREMSGERVLHPWRKCFSEQVNKAG